MMLFQHDCGECRFLLRYGERDIYRCAQMGHPTIVARWGDDGPDYESGPLVWLGRKNDGPQDLLGFEATADSVKVHNSDGIYRIGDRYEIALNPETARLIESIPEHLRLHPDAAESFDRLTAGYPMIDQSGILAARISGDIRAKIQHTGS